MIQAHMILSLLLGETLTTIPAMTLVACAIVTHGATFGVLLEFLSIIMFRYKTYDLVVLPNGVEDIQIR